jgi:pimeloyl-ACP methyl ester carboxylesterase
VYDVEKEVKYRGAAIEIFEECLLDIDAWIGFALKKGYDDIILEGHSFGTKKIQFYILNGKYKDKIKALILLGFTDSYGGQLEYLKTIDVENNKILEEAKQLISENKPFQLLSYWLINWGELPQSAQSYNSFMSPGSELSKILPLREKRKLSNFRRIKKPILGVVGDRNECTVIPPKTAVDLLNKENTYAKCFMINKCNHSYEGKEGELISIIRSFIKDL